MNFKRNAFTLIELLVVIVVIGILATISTATFRNMTEKAEIARIQAFAEQIELGSGIPLGYYGFSEGSPSSTTNGKGESIITGTISGASWVTESPSGDGSALSFDGSSFLIFGGTGDENDQAVKTISFWVDIPVEITSGTSNTPVLQFYEAPVGGWTSNPGIAFGDATSVCTGETLVIYNYEPSSWGRTCFQETISSGVHHFAFLWNGASYDIYIDGEKQSVVAGSYGHSQLINSDLLYIGRSTTTTSFSGVLDNIGIYPEIVDF